MFLIGWNHELCRVPYGTLGNLGGGTDECHMALLVGKGLKIKVYVFDRVITGMHDNRPITGYSGSSCKRTPLECEKGVHLW